MGGFTAPIVCVMRPVRLLVLVIAMIPVTGATFYSWGANTRYDSDRRACHIELGLSPHMMALSRPSELADRLESYPSMS